MSFNDPSVQRRTGPVLGSCTASETVDKCIFCDEGTFLRQVASPEATWGDVRSTRWLEVAQARKRDHRDVGPEAPGSEDQ
jgi:hypothetical protein